MSGSRVALRAESGDRTVWQYKLNVEVQFEGMWGGLLLTVNAAGFERKCVLA